MANKDFIQLSRLYNLRRGERRLSVADKKLLKTLRSHKQWGSMDRYYYGILEKKMLKDSKDLLKITQGNIDKIVKIIQPYFTNKEIDHILKVIYG